NAPAATMADRLYLGQTLKSQADLYRLNGNFSQAKAVYDRAIAILERANAGAGREQIASDLAIAIDPRGWVSWEIGSPGAAEQEYHRAVNLLEDLVKEFPRAPRRREALAKAYNSLGLLEETTGRLAAAETHLCRELPLVERLAQDFPARPEHR